MRILMVAAVLVVLGLAGGPALGGEPLAGKLPKRTERPMPALAAQNPAPGAGVNLLVEVSARHGEHEGSARFIVGDGSQANHVLGGDKPHAIKNNQGTGVEFKKWGFIFNVLPAISPRDRNEVFVQLQIELSGPETGITIPQGDVPAIGTWQYQSSFSVKKGRKTLVFESPARVEITVSDAPVGNAIP
ncbi:MAG: hypothetical protein HZB91_11430 [Elusimicrobia bacterium]|nr:hypothetical protein [Elusimicrobiota bacterium]